MRSITCLLIAGGVMCTGFAGGGLQAAHAGPETQPAAVLSEELTVVLDRFEQAGDGLQDLQCKVKYSIVQRIKENPDDPDEVQNYVGDIKFVRSTTDTVSLIHFEKWNDGRTWTKKEKWYHFDGRTLFIADELPKTVEKRQIVGPGEKIDPFKLGEGPFPLPFGQSKADVLAQFNVNLHAPGPDDPPHVDHISCIPKAATELAERYERIELYISNDDKAVGFGLPLKIVAVDRKEQVTKTVAFDELRKNASLKAQDIHLPAVTRKWEHLE